MAKINISLLPCSVFFSSGRQAAGSLALLMQLSLVFWPLAIRWAREFNEQQGVAKLLAEVAVNYRLSPVRVYSHSKKRFGAKTLEAVS